MKTLTFDLFDDLSSHTSLGRDLKYQLHIAEIVKVSPALNHIHPVILLPSERPRVYHVTVPCSHSFRDVNQLEAPARAGNKLLILQF